MLILRWLWWFIVTKTKSWESMNQIDIFILIKFKAKQKSCARKISSARTKTCHLSQRSFSASLIILYQLQQNFRRLYSILFRFLCVCGNRYNWEHHDGSINGWTIFFLEISLCTHLSNWNLAYMNKFEYEVCSRYLGFRQS